LQTITGFIKRLAYVTSYGSARKKIQDNVQVAPAVPRKLKVNVHPEN
jgi:hypothetical protein